MRDLRVAVSFVGIFVEIFVGRVFRVSRLRGAARGRGILMFRRIVYAFDVFAGWKQRRVWTRLGGSNGTFFHEAPGNQLLRCTKARSTAKTYFPSNAQFAPSLK
jgi:hypothetical protein